MKKMNKQENLSLKSCPYCEKSISFEEFDKHLNEHLSLWNDEIHDVLIESDNFDDDSDLFIIIESIQEVIHDNFGVEVHPADLMTCDPGYILEFEFLKQYLLRKRENLLEKNSSVELREIYDTIDYKEYKSELYEWKKSQFEKNMVGNTISITSFCDVPIYVTILGGNYIFQSHGDTKWDLDHESDDERYSRILNAKHQNYEYSFSSSRKPSFREMNEWLDQFTGDYYSYDSGHLLLRMINMAIQVLERMEKTRVKNSGKS